MVPIYPAQQLWQEHNNNDVTAEQHEAGERGAVQLLTNFHNLPLDSILAWVTIVWLFVDYQ